MIDTTDRRVDVVAARAVGTALVPVVAVWLSVHVAVPLDENLALLALGVVAVPVTGVALATTEAVARRWALERGARFRGDAVDQLRRHLLRTRVARTLGVTAAIAIDMMVTAVYNADPDRFRDEFLTWSAHRSGLWLLAFGYVAGSIWAEATKPRDRLSGQPGAAVLSRRRLRDFLDPMVARLVGAYAGLAGLAVVLWAAVSGGDEPAGEPWIVGALAPLAVAVLALVLAWWTCRRHQRARDDAALVYDELTRTATANALAGAGVAMLGEHAGVVMQHLWERGSVSGWLLVPFFLAALFGYGIWIGSGTKLVFRTRRIETMRAAA